MTTYVPFGRRYVQAGIDNGQNPFNNTGNWTAIFDPQTMNLPQGQFEVIKGTIVGACPGANFAIYNDQIQFDQGVIGSTGCATFYKASDAEMVISGGSGAEYVYFYFSDNANDGLKPMVTLWLAYDQELLINKTQFGVK